MSQSISFQVFIPARFTSSRVPAKMLADIGGKPMIQHVYERAKASQATAVTVATEVMTTLCAEITEAHEVFNPNVVKVVHDCHGHALYFSRAPIPSRVQRYMT